MTTAQAARPTIVSPDQRLELALRRADSEKQDILKEAAMERQNAVEDVQARLDAVLAENSQLQRQINILQKSTGRRASDGGVGIMRDKLNELQHQVCIMLFE